MPITNPLLASAVAVQDPQQRLQAEQVEAALAELAAQVDSLTPEAMRSGSYLIAGGGVAFTAGLSLRVSAAQYAILGTVYTSPETAVTASAADPTHDRIDVVVVDTLGSVAIVTGVPDANPEKPDIDPATQLELSFYIVPAGVASLSVTTTDVYHEGTEWTTSRSGTTNVFNATTAPLAGTVSIEGTAVTTGNYVRFQAPTSFDPNAQDLLVFYIRSKAAWPVTRQLSITLRASGAQRGTAVVLSDGQFGFASALTGAYQQIVVPVSAFGAGGLLVNQLQIQCTGSGGTIGYWIDDVVFQAGAAAVTDESRMRWRGLYVATVQYARNDLVRTADGAGYVAIQPALNRPPNTSPTFWQMAWAAPLQDGDKGDITVAGDVWTLDTKPWDPVVWTGDRKPEAGEVLLKFKVTRALTLAANLAGVGVTVDDAATAAAQFDVKKNGTTVATITINGTVPTLATTGGLAQSFAVDDVFEFVAPASQDATLAGVSVTFFGQRT